MIISKKQFIKVFENYTRAIHEECGRALSHKQKLILHNRIEKLAKEYTLKGFIKKVIAKFKEKQKASKAKRKYKNK